MKPVFYKAILITLSLSAGAGGHKLYATKHHPLKDTQQCTVLYRVSEHIIWFVRPNREIFEAYFDNPPLLMQGATYSHIYYTDDNADLRHFVKATVK
jgi:hypothetical protein